VTIADLTGPFLNVTEVFCKVMLFFYLLKVLKTIVWGRKGHHAEPLREAMAFAYTAIAAYFIFGGIGAIRMFVKNVLEIGEIVHVPAAGNIFLVVCAALVCAAFLCNFSRSLWMLKNLDHGVYDPVKNWAELTRPPRKRVLEFATRTGAALLFIMIELELESFAHHSEVANLAYAEAASSVPDHLRAAGGYGIGLYICLVAWWLVGYWLAKGDMPKRQIAYHVCGLVNSLFIFVYARSSQATEGEAWGMVAIVVLMSLSATFMLAFVIRDFAKGTRDAWKVARVRLMDKVVNRSAPVV
jgi:hypothetical protein